ncbi:hypothetical protein C8Q75DRAFT_599105 [Abortiporus biennis]|nr:hypothetical protein C8Q75DRAFT_599105 [Abortiporus biennis]
MGTYFPQELIDKVVDHLRDDKESLLSCSLIARSFQHSSRKGLFHKIKVKSWDDTQRLQDFTKFLSSKPPIAKYIQELELNGGMITRLETTMSMGTLCSILANVPNVHSLSLIGFGWSSSGEHAASPNDAFPPLSLRKLSINYFTIQCSEIDSQFQQLLALCSLFGTVGEFTVDQLWASGGRLDEPTYETIREWIEQAKQRDPSLVEKFQVSSLEVNADYINASFIMELIRNTSSPEHLSLHPSTIVEASTARALIAHSIPSLISLILNVTYEYEEADQAQLSE